MALVLLGPVPDLEQALYVTAVGLGLFMGAIGLFVMVFSQGHVHPARDQPAPPAEGGLGA